MQFEIEPHRGIGPISFGMTRAEVATAMKAIGGGPPGAKGETIDCFFEYCFQVEFDASDRVDFIAVYGYSQHVFSFSGRDVFDIPGDELVAIISALDRPDPELTQAGYEYVFPRLIISLWDLDTQYDRKGGEIRPVFCSVGVGTPHYLAVCRRIQSS